MRKIISFILKSKIYDKFHSIIGRKVFKLSKIFFVDTKHKTLPETNHPLDLSYQKEFQKYKNGLKSKKFPFMSYSHLVDLLRITEFYKNKEIRFLDYGAGNLELFAELSKNFKKLNFFYFDQPEYNEIIKNIKKSKSLKKLNIFNPLPKSNEKFDFVYFGGSLQYIPDYKKSLKGVFKKTKFIIVSQSPFYFNNFDKKNIVLKQLNLSDNLNFLYLFNFYTFVKFMEKNNFYLVSKNLNRVIKFLNFKNLRNNYKDIDMYDLLYKKK